MIQNLTAININFIFWTLYISSSFLMFILFLIGFILGWLLHNYSIHSREKVRN
ncbi:MAG: LapA family protein [Planctomycetota bacterium]